MDGSEIGRCQFGEAAPAARFAWDSPLPSLENPARYEQFRPRFPH